MTKEVEFDYDPELQCLVRIEDGKEVMRMSISINELNKLYQLVDYEISYGVASYNNGYPF